MSIVRKFAVVLLLGGVLLQVPAPTADGAMSSTSIRFLMNYVGKPVLKGAATTAGGLVAAHFAAKLAGAEEARITEADVEQLARQAQQQGISEAEMRRQVEQLVSASARAPIPRGGYSAIASDSPTKKTYLAQLEAACDRTSKMLNNWNEQSGRSDWFESWTGLLRIYRDHAGQWGRLVIPVGEEMEVRALQDLFDAYVANMQEPISIYRGERPPNNNWENEMRNARRVFSTQIRRFGSTKCAFEGS